ncbi:MAG: Gfo/Idh/MocA family oxidoreductase [Marinilabiliaceae bacterium]|nr:Gfo/Idh/MocA family oxidoreductase [Marinilabiliaceae bacterium]
MIKDKIRFAVVGLGHIGKRHVEMINRNVDAEVVGLCDVLSFDQLGLNTMNVPFFNSIEKLLSSGIDIDVICICTPNGLHAKQAINVLEHEINVVVEKPIALSKADAEQVIFKSLEVSKSVFAVMQNRYSPPSRWLKGLIDENWLGNIFMVQFNCFWNRDDRYYHKGGWHGTKDLDGGTLFTQFSHFIDTLYWLFGDISNIEARFEDFNHKHLTDFEDSGIIQFELKGGGLGCFNYSTSVWDQNLESSVTIIGAKGSVKVGGQYMNEVSHCHIKDYQMPELEASNPPNDYGTYKGSAANHHYVIDNVISTLKGEAKIKTNALEGLKVVEIIERIYKCKK